MGSPADDVAERAYLRWLRRNQPHSSELLDWLGAEAECRRLAALTRQFAEGAPSESTQLLWAILDNSPAVVYAKDARGRYLFVNRRHETLFRVPRDQITSLTDYDIFPRALADVLRSNDQRVLAAGAPLEFEEVVPQADGPHAYISLKFPVSDPAGVPYAVCGVSTDITERKQAQRRLAAEHAVTRALAHSASLAEAAPLVLRAVCECLGWGLGALWAVNRPAGELRCVEVWQAPGLGAAGFEALSRRVALVPGVGLPGRVWAAGRPVWLPDVAAEGGYPRAGAALDSGLHGACGFPVRGGGEVLGVLEFLSTEVRQPDEELLAVMEGVGSQVSQFIERRQAEQAVHEREGELRLARQIQRQFLPHSAPDLAGFEIQGESEAAQETGGDFFDFIPEGDGSLWVAVGDASGHGIAAALMVTEARAYLRALVAAEADPGAVLARVNRHLAGDLGGEHFVTLFLARLFPRTHSLLYGNAGHWPGYVLDRGGEVREVLGSTGLPLGVDPEGEFPAAPALTLDPGELVLLLTDGVVDAFSPDDARFGIGRALAVVREYRSRPPGEIVARLLSEVRAFTHAALADDSSAVVIRVESIHAGRTGGG